LGFWQIDPEESIESAMSGFGAGKDGVDKNPGWSIQQV